MEDTTKGRVEGEFDESGRREDSPRVIARGALFNRLARRFRGVERVDFTATHTFITRRAS